MSYRGARRCTFADRKSDMKGSACVYVSWAARGASPPTIKTSFRPHARTHAASSAAWDGPATQRAARWGTGVWPRDRRLAQSCWGAGMPREGEQVTETRDAGGRERMQSLAEGRGMIS